MYSKPTVEIILIWLSKVIKVSVLFSKFLVNDTCLTESYSSLKYPCFYIGRCNYNEFFKTNTDGTKVKGSLKQSNTTTNETCFIETITDSITFSANITYDSNTDSSCAIKSGNIQTNVSFLKTVFYYSFSMSTNSKIKRSSASMSRQMLQEWVKILYLLEPVLYRNLFHTLLTVSISQAINSTDKNFM